MPLTEDVIDAAPALAAAVVQEWATAADRFNWRGIRKAIDEDHLADLVRRLGEAALARQDGASGPSRELVWTAVLHGVGRREDGFTEEMLFQEYYLLRRCMWGALKRKSPESAAETIMRIDAEITMATNASLQGFHLENRDLIGERLLDEIAKRWSAR